MRGTSRLTGHSINTITKLLIETGKACAEYQYIHLRNLSCKRIEVDELWSFCYAKQKNLPQAKSAPQGAGNIWTWVAICPDTKIVPCWLVSNREWRAAYRFMTDLKTRLANRVQLTTDGYNAYPMVVEAIFGNDINFAMLVKHYENEDSENRQGRYVGSDRTAVLGNPELPYVTTAHVERQNLTMRMECRRYARKTNAHSKKIENHALAVSMHFMYYNFARIHKSLRITPAMAAKVTDHVWEIEEISNLLDKTSK